MVEEFIANHNVRWRSCTVPQADFALTTEKLFSQTNCEFVAIYCMFYHTEENDYRYRANEV